MTNLITKDKIIIDTDMISEFVWKTILFNCDCHTFETVIEQLIIAIKCSRETAEHLAYVADQFGSVVIYKGTKNSCENVADILGRVGLLVKVIQ
jgi:hypothetical protein